MKIIAKHTIMDGTAMHQPGAELDLPDSEANRLLRLGAAEKVEIPSAAPLLPSDSEEDGNEEEFMSEEEYAEILEQLSAIDGVNHNLAEALVEAGYQSLEVIAEADEKELVKLGGIGKKSVKKIIQSAAKLVDASDG